MPIVLKIESGPQANTSLPIEQGGKLRVGRTSQADHAIPEDPSLSRIHFEIEFDGQTCWLRDLKSSNGTLLNGASTVESRLKDRDTILAGQTHFRLYLEEQPLAAPPAPPPEEVTCDRLLTILNSHLQPLYAIINAAQEPAILKLLIESKVPYQSLFEGEAMYRLVHFAPYLVPLAPGSPLLQALIETGWTKNWGIYFTSNAAPWELLAFFHRLLLTQMPDRQPALLRYYDPRVLRTLVMSSAPHQLLQLFGPVRVYLMEGEDPDAALAFSLKPQGLERIELPLAGPEGPKSSIVEARPAFPMHAGATSTHLFVPTEDQIALLGKMQRDSIHEELIEELRELHPARFEGEGEARMQELVKYGARRPQRYGIRTQPDVTRYIKLMVRLGRDFDIELPWAAQLLGRRLPPAEKLNRLWQAAGAYLASVPKP